MAKMDPYYYLDYYIENVIGLDVLGSYFDDLKDLEMNDELVVAFSHDHEQLYLIKKQVINMDDEFKAGLTDEERSEFERKATEILKLFGEKLERDDYWVRFVYAEIKADDNWDRGFIKLTKLD